MTDTIPTPSEIRARSTIDRSLLTAVKTAMKGEPNAHPSGGLCYQVPLRGQSVDLSEVEKAVGDAWVVERTVFPDKRAFVLIIEAGPGLKRWRSDVAAMEAREKGLMGALAEFQGSHNELREIARAAVLEFRATAEALGKKALEENQSREAQLVGSAKALAGVVKASIEQVNAVVKASNDAAQKVGAAVADIRAARIALGGKQGLA